MDYVAIHHVPIGKKTFTPGEIIDVVIPEQTKERLLNKGAIKEMIAPLFPSSGAGAPTSPQEEGSEGGKDEAEDQGKADSEDSETSEASEVSDASDASEASEDVAEVVEDAPEIDVTDGLVTHPQADPQAIPQPEHPIPARRGKKS